MNDQTDPMPPTSVPDADSEPLAADTGQAADPGAGGPSPAATPLPALPSVSSAQLRAAWSGLGPISQLIGGASIAVIVVAILGGAVGAWDSSDFLLLILVGGIAGAAAAWFTSTTEAGPKPSPLPLASIELAAGAVVAVLGVWRVIELIFDLDQVDRFGGAVGVLLTVALGVVGVAMLVGALRRDPTVRGAVLGGDQGTRLAVGGLVLVLIGWALNLSIGDWTMAGGTLSLAAATFGAVVIVVAPRWSRVLPGLPVAWIGAAFGALVAILAIDQWGALMHHGILTELGLTDYAAFLASVVGVVGIVAGGVLAGMPTWQARPKAPAPTPGTPVAPETTPTPETPVASTEPPAPPA